MRPGLVLRNFAWVPWPLLLAAAGVGLFLCEYRASFVVLPALCSTAEGLAEVASWPIILEATLAFNSPQRMLADWALMLVAMMPPLLAMPIMHVWRSSLPSRRVRALVCFLLGYCTLWMLAGPVLIILALLLRLVVADGALIGSLLVAMIWSSSPLQRFALNRAHRVRRIGLFGWKADRDSCAYGATHGIWCIASCWAWMLVPLMGGGWHVLIMLFASAAMLAERLAPTEPVRWHWPAILPNHRYRSIFPAQQAVPGG